MHTSRQPLWLLLLLAAACHSPAETAINTPPVLEAWAAPNIGERFTYQLTITDRLTTGSPVYSSYWIECRKVDTASAATHGRLIEHFYGNGRTDYTIALEIGGDITIGDFTDSTYTRFPTGGGLDVTTQDSANYHRLSYLGTETITIEGKPVVCLHVLDSLANFNVTSAGVRIGAIDAYHIWFAPGLGIEARTLRNLHEYMGNQTLKDQTIEEMLVSHQ